MPNGLLGRSGASSHYRKSPIKVMDIGHGVRQLGSLQADRIQSPTGHREPRPRPHGSRKWRESVHVATAGSLFFSEPRWQDLLAFLVLSLASYVLLLWATQTRALRFAVIIVGIARVRRVGHALDLKITVGSGRAPASRGNWSAAICCSKKRLRHCLAVLR